jgi:hypothetical protein
VHPLSYHSAPTVRRPPTVLTPRAALLPAKLAPPPQNQPGPILEHLFRPHPPCTSLPLLAPISVQGDTRTSAPPAPPTCARLFALYAPSLRRTHRAHALSCQQRLAFGRCTGLPKVHPVPLLVLWPNECPQTRPALPRSVLCFSPSPPAHPPHADPSQNGPRRVPPQCRLEPPQRRPSSPAPPPASRDESPQGVPVCTPERPVCAHSCATQACVPLNSVCALPAALAPEAAPRAPRPFPLPALRCDRPQTPISPLPFGSATCPLPWAAGPHVPPTSLLSWRDPKAPPSLKAERNKDTLCCPASLCVPTYHLCLLALLQTP